VICSLNIFVCIISSLEHKKRNNKEHIDIHTMRANILACKRFHSIDPLLCSMEELVVQV